MKQFAEWFLDRDFPSSLVLAGIGSLCLFGFVGKSEILMLSVIFSRYLSIDKDYLLSVVDLGAWSGIANNCHAGCWVFC